MRWEIVQAVDVKFSQDSTYQKSLKSVTFWQSYSKNKKVDIFGTQCISEMVQDIEQGTVYRLSNSTIFDELHLLQVFSNATFRSVVQWLRRFLLTQSITWSRAALEAHCRWPTIYLRVSCSSLLLRWRGSATGIALDLRSVGRGFKSYSRQRCVTTLGKLFTPMCFCHQAE